MKTIRFIVKTRSIGMMQDVKVYSDIMDSLVKNYPHRKCTIILDETKTKLNIKKSDINFFIEKPDHIYLLEHGNCMNVLMCNYEFLIYKNTHDRDIENLRKMDYILCKTKIASEYCMNLKKKYNLRAKLIYTKHTTPVLNIRPKFKNNNWIHAAGSSPWKGTDTIINAWLKHPEWPKLVVTCRGRCKDNLMKYVDMRKYTSSNFPRNISIVDYIQNEIDISKYGNHLCPSILEGYGHYINMARATESFIVTTNYAPMNELVTNKSGVLINCSRIESKQSSEGVNMCILSVEDFEKAMDKILRIPESEKRIMRKAAYNQYISDKKFFTRVICSFVKNILLSK